MSPDDFTHNFDQRIGELLRQSSDRVTRTNPTQSREGKDSLKDILDEQQRMVEDFRRETQDQFDRLSRDIRREFARNLEGLLEGDLKKIGQRLRTSYFNLVDNIHRQNIRELERTVLGGLDGVLGNTLISALSGNMFRQSQSQEFSDMAKAMRRSTRNL